MSILPSTSTLYNVSKVGLGGANFFDLPCNIDDTELASVKNMVFTDGLLQPRQGSQQVLGKPAGETGTAFQMLKATNSKGVDFLIAVYGTNFYLWDTINNQFIKINSVYSPATSGVFYGSTNWNNGTADDRFYFGNGIDDVMKWTMAVSTLSTTTASANTTITLASALTFPATGSLVIMNAGTLVPLTYTSINKAYVATTIAFTSSNTITDSANGFVTAGYAIGDVITVMGTQQNNTNYTVTNVVAGTLTVKENTIAETAGASMTLKAANSNVITLSGTVGAIIPAGSTVVCAIADAKNIPIGSVFTTSQGRLWTANAQGAENTLHYSMAGNPENYTYSSSGVNSGGFYALYKGKGGILGMTDFGQYLLIEKVDVLSQFIFNYASDNSGFTVQVTPIISGDGIGPANTAEILNYMNELYYPTAGEGIVSFSPNTTGNSTSSGVTLLSQKINNVVTEQYSFNISRTCGLNQKLYWAVSSPNLGTPASLNNLVLMYDLVRAGENATQSAWTIFNNWNAVDIKPVNGNLYYLSASDGALYEAYEGYSDAVNGVAIPYTASFGSKRFNLNSPATLMRAQYVYVEGCVALGTTFYMNVLHNENGSLGIQSYQVNGSNQTIVAGSFVGGLGAFVLGSPLLGGVDFATIVNEQNMLFFRAYLEVSQSFRPHNIQLECFSNTMGSQWGISTICLITQPEQSIETALVLSPSTASVVAL
jgi:hypothetical protein